MNNYFKIIFVSLLIYTSTGTQALETQPETSSQEPADTKHIPLIERYSHHLKSLSPQNIDAYFTLAEEMLRSANTESDIKLASQVLAIGAGLAQNANKNELAASMCIALASVSTVPETYRILWDITLLLDPSRKSSWVQHRDRRLSQVIQLRQSAARCLYATRFSLHREASTLWEDTSVRRTILDTAQSLNLDPTEVRKTINTLLSHAADDSCRGRVFLTKREDGQTHKVVCPDHSEPIGVGLSEDSLAMFIKLELALLKDRAATQSSGWQINAYLDRLAPLKQPSIDFIYNHYHVDPQRPYWRQGRWTSKASS